ncbi:hypothetical protein WK99_17430 [Burkholderia ubonensis]|nr:hypothetical protein WK99_17430 [Burkholderia ubonensis]OJB05558.1 hypothetical protein BGV48_16720 [Burkholderia ubonensis]
MERELIRKDAFQSLLHFSLLVTQPLPLLHKVLYRSNIPASTAGRCNTLDKRLPIRFKLR